MDIAKYIGLFLLKNKYCCLQGLGNLEIKKTPAAHNGAELTGASYYAVLNPVGSIDDAFPNFVANNEQVSIAKASNEISEFIRTAKQKIAEGGSVVIPSVGQYLMKNNKLSFELDAAFSMPASNIVFPVAEKPKPEPVESAKQGADKPYENFASYNNYNKQSSVNWNIIAFWGVIIIIAGSILAWSINYFMKQQPEQTEIVQQEVKPAAAPAKPLPTAVNDSAMAASANTAPVSDTMDYKFVIKEYKTLAQAQKKEKQLISYGYQASVVNKDSNNFLVVNTLRIYVADTTKVKDSLTKLLNPAGVTILH